MTGKSAIRAYLTRGSQTPGSSISWVTERWTVADAGDMAYGIGRNTATYRDGSGELRTVLGKGATVWRNDPAGWKCVLDVWNETSPPPR